MRRVPLGELTMVVGLAGLLVWLFWPEPVAVEVAELSRTRIASTVRAEGRVRVKELYTVAAPLGGRLHRISLKPGDAVLAGEAVALLGPALPDCLDEREQAVTEAALAAAEAAAQAATAARTAVQAAETTAAAEWTRIRALAAPGFASRAVLDRATTSLTARRAEGTAAIAAAHATQHRAEWLRARLRPVDTEPSDRALLAVTAPASGRVLEVLEESETVVLPGQSLLTLGDPAEIEVVVPLPSEQVVGLRPGLPVRLERWGGPALPGRVARIEPAGRRVLSLLGFEEQHVAVIIDLTTPPPAGLNHGYRVDVTIEREAHEDLRIPVGALVRHDGAWTAYVVADGLAHRRPLATLEPGALVVVHPGERVADGVKVRLR